jgi:DNA invertase Pin-like site-specific DNA recombinase
MTANLVPAAQYLRMSTEHQQYSLDNQADAIARYAAQHGFRVVKTYSDAARSGLLLKNRDGLKQLLKDVMDGQQEFRAILVYDVSRWGRFQDTDEAAHYEYMCKSAGVPVHYCAEMFTNDNSVSGLILKALKRTMAGEYSRELSVKVRNGLVRLAKLGFKLGGSAPYGLRRQLLDNQGKPKQVLAYGERKSLADEHVTFIPGPSEEIETVRRIFREFADEQRNPNAIAARLNRDGIPFVQGGTWTGDTVRMRLQDARYIGMHIWGRTTAPLHTRVKRVPYEQWEICRNAFPPIISTELFIRAQQTFANITCRLTEEQLLERLRHTFKAYGQLSARIIDESRLCPGTSTYYQRFGGMLNVYARLGYDTPQARVGQAANRVRGLLMRDALMKQILETFPGQIEEVRRKSRLKPLLRYRKTGLLIAVVVTWCYPTKTGASWRIRHRVTQFTRPTIVGLLDRRNRKIESLRVFPRLSNQQLNIRYGPIQDSPRTGLALENISDLFSVLKRARQG